MKYRTIIHCDKCGAEYMTIKLKKEMPTKCKMAGCGSIQIRKIKSWVVEK